MPMLIFIFGCLIIIAFVKNFRLVMSMSLVAFTAIFIFINANNPNIYYRINSFIKEINFMKNTQIKKIVTTFQKDKKEKLEKIDKERKTITVAHNEIYNTSLEMWKMQPLFGHGLKSFRFVCWTILSETPTSTT